MTNRIERPGKRVAIFVDGPGGIGKTNVCNELRRCLHNETDDRGMGAVGTYYHFPSPGVPMTFDAMLRDQLSVIASFGHNPSTGIDLNSARDQYVVFDRWGMSTAVYQGLDNEGGHRDLAMQLVADAYEGLMYLFDDVIFITLNGDPEVLLRSKLDRLVFAAKEADVLDVDALAAKIATLRAKAGLPALYENARYSFFETIGKKATLRSPDGGVNHLGQIERIGHVMRYAAIMAPCSLDKSEAYAFFFPKRGGGRLTLIDATFDTIKSRNNNMQELCDFAVSAIRREPVEYEKFRPPITQRFERLAEDFIRLDYDRTQR